MRLSVVRPLPLLVAFLLTGCGVADEVERIAKVADAEEQQQAPAETSCPAEVQVTFAEELCKLAGEGPGCAVAELYNAQQAAVIFDGLVWACEHNEPEDNQ